MPEGHPFNISVHELINTLVCIRQFGLILLLLCIFKFLARSSPINSLGLIVTSLWLGSVQ